MSIKAEFSAEQLDGHDGFRLPAEVTVREGAIIIPTPENCDQQVELLGPYNMPGGDLAVYTKSYPDAKPVLFSVDDTRRSRSERLSLTTPKGKLIAEVPFKLTTI